MSAPALSVSAFALSVSADACCHPPSPCAGGAGIASSRGLADGCSEAELLLCATGGAGEEQANRSGSPVGASAAWDSDCGLSNWSGVFSGAAGGACSLCLWSCAALPGLPGPESSFSSTYRGWICIQVYELDYISAASLSSESAGPP
jgi:hypothetical protein